MNQNSGSVEAYITLVPSFVCILFFLTGFLSKSYAQDYANKDLPGNAIYIEMQGIREFFPFIKYERTVFTHHLSPDWHGKLFPVAGFGYHYFAGNDYKYRHYFGLLGAGYSLGWRRHELELDAGLFIDAEQSGYGIADGPLETEIYRQVIIAYRFTTEKFFIRLSVNRYHNSSVPFHLPGLGIGFRF